MMRVLVAAVALTLASPAAAKPWRHPSAGFALDIPAGWDERVESRTATGAVFLPSPSFLANIACTVVAAPLGGPPATPAGWRMPDEVLANPTALLTRNGDRVSAILGKQKFGGLNGFPGWQLWADVVSPGGVAPYFKLITHVLSGPNAQITAVCITPANVRGSLNDKTIQESLALGVSLRAAP